MDYGAFTTFVIGSSKRDGSSLGFTNANAPATDENGNSEQMLRRKVREFWKELHAKFKFADPDKTGNISPDALNDILNSCDICFPPADFAIKCKALDVGNSGMISYAKFLAPYSKGSSFDKDVVKTIKGVTISQAKQMIVEKLQGRIQGGPAGLRRAFRFFDRDGSNAIDVDELTQVVTEYLGMAFEKEMFAQLHSDFAGGKPEIDLHSFTKNLMGSTRTSSTGLDSRAMNTNSKMRDRVSNASGNSDMFIRRKVKEHWKNLQFSFQHADSDGSGIISPTDLRQILEAHDIILADSQFDDLVKKLDFDGDGDISYEEFFSYFRQGQKATTGMDALVGVIKERDVNVKQAQDLIRDKMRGKLAGGPSELRRTFQMFDQDGGGTIDCAEFEKALQLTCGLRFEKQLIEKVMDKWSKGTGEMNFTSFCAGVMDSKAGDSTSFGGHLSSTKNVSNDNGNSLQFIIRKVRERFVDLKVALRHACNSEGNVTPQQLRDVLFRFDIVLTDGTFNEIIKQIDVDGDGDISPTEFTNMFGPGRADDKDKISTIKYSTPQKALELIQEKVRGRLASGPGEMRRAFAFFDRDGGGTIDLQEFEQGLAALAGLRFDKTIMDGLMKILDSDGTGELNYAQFCKHVLQSKGDSAETSFVNDTNARAVGTAAGGNSAPMLRRKIREKWKLLITDFKHRSDKDGDMSPNVLNDILYKHDIIIADNDFKKMCQEMDTDGDGTLSYDEFLNYFKPGQGDEKMVSAEVSTMTAADAIVLIREKVESRLAGGPSGLRRAWKTFDKKAAGKVAPKEFAGIVRKVVGINFNQQTMDAVIAAIDDDGVGAIDYRKFCENVMDSNRQSMTSMTDTSGNKQISAQAGNTDQFLLRKVRMAWKPLITMFKHETDDDGNLTPIQLRDVLFRNDIILADQQFTALVQKMDKDGDGEISYEEFLAHFAVGSEADKEVITTLRPMPISQAKNLIRSAIEQKLDGGEGGLRRAFQFFDRDKSGAIDLEEFRVGLARYCGIQFESEFLVKLMAEFNDGSGQIHFKSFSERVMGSSNSDATGINQPVVALPSPHQPRGIGKDNVADIKLYIHHRIEAKNSKIAVIFRKFDDDKSGKLSYDEFHRGLLALGVELNDNEFDMLVAELDNDGGGEIDYREFVEDMKDDSDQMPGPFSENQSSARKSSIASMKGTPRNDLFAAVNQKLLAKGISSAKFAGASPSAVRADLLRLGFALADEEVASLMDQWGSGRNGTGSRSGYEPEPMSFGGLGAIDEDVETDQPQGQTEQALELLRARLRDLSSNKGSGSRRGSRSFRRSSIASQRSARRSSGSRRPSLAGSVSVVGGSLVLGPSV